MTQKNGKKKIRSGFILRTIWVVAVLYMLSRYFIMTAKVDNIQNEVDTLRQQAAVTRRTTEKLDALVTNPTSDDYIMHIAREKLGYVMPGEYIFVDVDKTK